MNKKPEFYCFGASHKSAPAAVRETLYLEPDQLRAVMAEVHKSHELQEFMVLSTCNRFELYGFSKGEPKTSGQMQALWHELQIKAGKAPLSNEAVKKHTYFLSGSPAIEHVFSVAASLDSLIVGETQITGQFKSAINLAAEMETLGPLLDRLSQDVLGVAKRVRTKTRIGEKKVSISHAAIDLARRVFRNLEEHSFLVVGAGEMAMVAARYACTYNPKAIHVVNRTRNRAEGLVNDLGTGRAHDWEDLESCLINSDIVISSTGSMSPVITRLMMKRVMRARRGKTLFLVDIAIPRDIESGCGDLDDVYLFEIDDLEKVVEGNLEERRAAGEEARIYVRRGARIFSQWLSTIAVKPTLAAFRDYLEDLTSRECEKTLGRSLFSDLSGQQREALSQMLNAVAGKILGDAARAVNKPGEEAIREQLAASIRIMFSRKITEEEEKQEGRNKKECSSQIIRL